MREPKFKAYYACERILGIREKQVIVAVHEYYNDMPDEISIQIGNYFGPGQRCSLLPEQVDGLIANLLAAKTAHQLKIGNRTSNEMAKSLMEMDAAVLEHYPDD